MRISLGRGKGKIRHNNRDFISANVDEKRIKDNITFVKEDIKKAYENEFGEALKNFNKRMINAKRNGRVIDDYYTHLFGESTGDAVVKNNNQQSNFYEWVVGVGDKDTTGYFNEPEKAKIAEKCLDIYWNGDKEIGLKSFQERNPQLHVFNAVMHRDESTPHLHFDAFPVAHGYKNGLEKQNAITKALHQMGYGKGAETIKNFTISERKILTDIAKANGLEIDEEQHGVREKTLSCEEYREAAEKMKQELKPQAKHQALEEAMNEIGLAEPTPTKTKKKFGGRTAEVPKTEEEIKRDREIALAQSIIREREEILKSAERKSSALLAEASEQISVLFKNSKTERIKEENAVKALKKARSDVLKNLKDSLPPPQTETAQRAIEFATRQRQKQIREMTAEVYDEPEIEKPTEKKFEIERD